jgi:hypothetical protein
MWGNIMTEYFSKAHDLLKLCDNYRDTKIHYCPDCLGGGNKELLNEIKK